MAQSDFGHYKLLLVEDEPITRELLNNLLIQAGFRNLTCAENGFAALECMRQEQFDLVLTDIEMPKLNGLELLRRIRSSETPQPRESKVIVITGHDEVAVLGTAIALDASGVIKKSTSVAALRERIHHLLQAPAESVRPAGHYKKINTDVLPEADDHPGFHHGDVENLSIDQLVAGMVLARPVVSARGHTLLSAGEPLSSARIRLLQDLTEFLPDRSVSVMREHLH
jgi:two-component system chemotaxis response regulator CheY